MWPLSSFPHHESEFRDGLIISYFEKIMLLSITYDQLLFLSKFEIPLQFLKNYELSHISYKATNISDLKQHCKIHIITSPIYAIKLIIISTIL